MCTETDSSDDFLWDTIENLYDALHDLELENEELREKKRELAEECDMLTQMLKVKENQINQMVSRQRLLVSNLNQLIDDMKSEIRNGDHT